MKFKGVGCAVLSFLESCANGIKRRQLVHLEQWPINQENILSMQIPVPKKDIIAHLELTFIRCVSIPRESRSKYRTVIVRSGM